MKLSTTWLKKSLRRTISEGEIVTALESAGIEVEQIISTIPLDPTIVVGLVKKCMQHPNADRLKITEIELPGQILTIVCGAPNVRVDLKVAVAQVGSALPSGDVITRAKLRGQVSEGMLCSARELVLGEDHDGIIELAADLAIGTKLCDVYPADTVVDVKTAANRFDLQSVVGLAREVAAQTSNELLLAKTKKLKIRPGDPGVVLEVSPEIVGRFMLAEVTIGTLQEGYSNDHAALLQASGVRSISPIVDITNFVMLELGHPLHAYDADKVKGQIRVRQARKAETLETLDGVKRRLTPDDLVIADDRGAIGLAGVMGGAATVVDGKTKRIYLESASFRGSIVRKMAKRHGLRSEASARYERGLPVQLTPIALARALFLIEAAFEAKVITISDNLTVWPYEQRIGLRRSKLHRLMGIALTDNEIIAALAGLGIVARPFDIVAEAKAQLGKPYLWGASFKQNGSDAFDCGYLIDYLYSLIGLEVGHSAPQIMATGREVALSELQPGDTLFRDGVWKKLKRADRDGVSHVALYIGDGKILHAENYHLVNGEWAELPKARQEVRIDDLEVITKAPGFIGARRHDDHLQDWISVPAVPWWRPDLKLAEDLIEEIVREVGYDRVPSTLPAWRPQDLVFDRDRTWRKRLRDVLFGGGLFEVMTYSFVSEEQLLELGSDPTHYLKLQNPLSSEQAYLRRSPLPSLLATLGRNAKYSSEVGLYELTAVFEPNATAGELPAEPERLAVIWRGRNQSYVVIKGLLDRLATELALELVVEPSKDVRFADGRSAVVKLGGQAVGWIGQLKPELVRRHKLTGEIAYMELDVLPLLAAARPTEYRQPSRFPAARRDLAVVITEDINWQQLRTEAMRDELAMVTFLSDYRGNDLPAGHKSVAMRLEMTAADHTLSEIEVEARLAQIQRRLESAFKAALR